MTVASGALPEVVVAPASGRGESLLFAFAVLILVTATAGYVLLRPKAEGPPPLLSWQVSSFDGLSKVDQAIHSALLPAAEEIIWNNNDTGGWYNIDDLQQIRLPPFYRDPFWKINGELRWQLVFPGATDTKPAIPTAESVHQEPGEPPPPPNAVYKGTLGQGATSYFGTGGKLPGQSAFLVVIGHAHSGVFWINQATIWIHKNPNPPFPKVTKTEALIQEGWRQVIPYSGASEVERLQGDG